MDEFVYLMFTSVYLDSLQSSLLKRELHYKIKLDEIDNGRERRQKKQNIKN